MSLVGEGCLGPAESVQGATSPVKESEVSPKPEFSDFIPL